jgi:hypothetical protein
MPAADQHERRPAGPEVQLSLPLTVCRNGHLKTLIPLGCVEW